MKGLFGASALVTLGLVVVASAAEKNASRPVFKATSIKAPFLEQFTDDWESRWAISHATKEVEGADVFSYVGKWSVEEASVLPGLVSDKGLVLKSPAAHHAISARFDKPVDNTDKTLVVQYEVKLQKGLDCGGAYLKLLTENPDLHQEEFSDKTEYQIMFGPDKCGATNKVHFIFRHKNPKTGEYEEKHLNSPPTPRIVKSSTLYTLIVNPDQTFEIRIDGEEAKKGSLLEDFTPSVNPPKEIDDPKDKKPSNWVEEAKINDPKAKKPADWDESEPFEIEDADAEKPDDWLEDEAEFIPDPEAEKPDTWDDEEDGDWIPPSVPNPKCDEVSGCGPWKRPVKKNPKYKGKWTPPKIDNPAYKGVWKPRRIANPDYFEDKTPSKFEPFGAIGFELWTMTSDILFNNIYIGHSIEDAEALQKETFDVKKVLEVAAEDEIKSQTEPPMAMMDKIKSILKNDPVGFVTSRVTQFARLFKIDPLGAFRLMPEVGVTIMGAFTVLVTILTSVFIWSGQALVKPEEPKKEEKSKAKANGGDEKKRIEASTEENEPVAAADDSGSEARPVRRSTRKAE